MANVYANGLALSGKATPHKTIAAFPDVCMTPPENPATPPGVPVPYPNFAFSTDTASGSSTVKAGDKTINLKNNSNMSKTTGDEAGCAAKKGVITSKNTGKSFFKMWSMNVKAEGKPVTRMTDITTNNHGSPLSNTPPFPHIHDLNISLDQCADILADYDLEMVPHGERHKDEDKKCPPGFNSEHTIENQFFACRGLRSKTCKHWKDYTENGARCTCMHTTYDDGKKIGPASETVSYEIGGIPVATKGSDHHIKGQMAKKALAHKPCMSLEDFMDICVDATLMCHSKTAHLAYDDPERVKIGSCLAAENMADIEKSVSDDNKAEDDDGEKTSKDKKQGQFMCHTGGGSCENREAAGMTSGAFGSGQKRNLKAAEDAGRC